MFAPFVHYDPVGLGRGFAGGVVIALSTSALMFLLGEVSGISSILAAVYRGTLLSWRGSFLAGLLFAGGILTTVSDPSGVFGLDLSATGQVHWLAALFGGLLVGAGTNCANGCTSGHGVIGLARLSPRSLAAVCAFMGAAIITASLFRAPFSQGADAAGARWGLAPGYYVLVLVCVCAALAPLSYFFIWAAAPVDARAAACYSGGEEPRRFTPCERFLKQLVACLCGLSFGLGLGLSGMTDPNKVLRFLDFLGNGGWDPQLMLVMGGGVCVNLVTYRAMAVGALKGVVPRFRHDAFGGATLGELIAYGPACQKNKGVLDWRLIGGSLMFGVGCVRAPPAPPRAPTFLYRGLPPHTHTHAQI